ncbi:putative disease resistance RPP13-like protein 1 isoform X1 [Arachis hypogaea]|uniref:putative disease resistance RPP13-like protein 1 isoform X1 n=2 Tax=Arachis hypogaea TaxID=3818 RepID=UPI0034E71F11|nr:Putative disease resistance RPP13-like protein [Arachis hypogaea]
MAEALVAGSFLSASVQTLLETITSVQFQDFFRKTWNLNESILDELETTLLTLQAVLNDAEQKQITNPSVKEWLQRLKDAVHEAEDLLDEVNTVALRHNLEDQHPHQSVAGKVRRFLCSGFRFHMDMNSNLEALCRRLRLFAAQKNGLGLQLVSMRVLVRAPTSSVANELGVVGRDGDKEKLMSFLLTNDANGNNNRTGVITIFGMAGVGKTTLAQLLYNDPRVEENFDLKAWTSVSQVFDATVVTKALLESLACRHFEGDNLDFLQIELRQMVKGKKFLFVLDDLWNNKYVEWDHLRAPFSEGKQGSRIIITTRQRDVAKMTHTFPIYHLEPLSHEDCWSLLSKHSFENTDPRRQPRLEVIGRKIADKCGGLPIAAKTLGGILRSKVDENEWTNILNSNIWELLNDDILPALWLSYIYLPACLKRCFAYCSIFLKGYPLNKKHVVLLWMAEGLLQQGQEKSMEEMGNQYFDELLSRSIIQQEGECYVMHDLINDLATVVSGKSCNRFEGSEITESVRHFSYSRGKYDSSTKFESCYRAKCLRTFLPMPLTDDPTLWWYWKHYLTKRITHDFLLRQRRLRVLSLANYDNINELPNSIGNLLHLRFLDLSFTPIKRLSSAIFKLYNLQTLRLLYCQNLSELPADIGNLVKLRHLDITGTKLKMSRQITTLQHLQTLSTFVVDKQCDGLKLKDMRCFPKLQGKLSIMELCNVDQTIDALEANLKNKEFIEELVLDWSKQADQGLGTETEVLEHLQPSRNIKKFIIESYNGTKFPSWFANSSFSNIVFLSISGCNYCLFLPPLGQLPSLKELYVTRMKTIKIIGPEFYGTSSSSSPFQPFPSLEILSFEEMLDWEEWHVFSIEGLEFPFPSLKHLRLYNCPKLKGHLPRHLPSSLTDVNISYCDQLEASTLHWIASTKSLTIIDGGQHLLPILETDSQCSLSYMKIERSDRLTSLPRMVLSSHCLSDLYLTKVPSFTSFPTESMPSLRTLMLSECKNLEFLPDEACRNYSSLENLMIWDSCHSLSCFPFGSLPVLKYLHIWGCPNLISISLSSVDSYAQNLSNLQILRISNCPNLESFPQGGLSTPNLMEFKVINCGKLNSLPERMNILYALQDLDISNVPQLVSFPQGGLPPKLRSVFIGFCKSLSPVAIAEYGFQWLSSLLKLGIGGDDLVQSFLEENSNAFQHLTILQELHILRCSKIESLPEDRLPSSLLLLRIQDCPLLEARYNNRRKTHFSKISHIPTIRINEDVII